MAIQFRTRTKSTIDYSSDLKSTGVCCDVNGNKSQKTLLECFQTGGNFQYGNIDEITCPKAGATGCCCACDSSFSTVEGESVACGEPITTSIRGLSTTTQCECNRLGGRWSSAPCPTSTMTLAQARSFCLKSYPSGELGSGCTTLDARIPRSCCYMERDESNIPTKVVCKNVCRSADCIGYTFSNEPAIYSKNKLCSGTMLGIQYANCAANNFSSLYSTGTELFQDFEHGPCFTLKKVNNEYSYSCEFKSESLCDGYWTPMLDDMKVCNHDFAPQDPVKIGSRIIEPESMSETLFDSLNLIPGKSYKGGLYVGKYEPGSPITPSGSSLYGSESPVQTNAQTFYSNANGPGEKSNAKWALIVEPTVYTTKFLDNTEAITTSYYNLSDYDGFYNCYGDNKKFNGMKTKLTNTICGKDRKAFLDFYLPSLKELQFFANVYREYTGTFQEYFELKGSFMTSTLKNDKLLYTQYLSLNDSQNYGRVILSTLTTKLSILFFRRILLT